MPQLRPDVETIESAAADGSPSLLVHDPVAETFDRVDWPESDIVRLLRQPRTLPELSERFARLGTLRPTLPELSAYIDHLADRGWLRSPASWPRRCAAPPRPGFAAKAARLLFLQIPLVRPAGFLRATAGLARLFLNEFSAAAVLLVGLCGLCLALPRWEEFWAAVAGSATLAGAPGFLAALIAVKAAHELAHAYAATLRGARVKHMGVALFFFMPLPFTDVTDGWRLPWPARLRVATAGLFAEVSIGAAALLLWALAPPGAAAALLARLATVALVSTLATNLNPGIRFDGYFILVCLMRTENLRARGMNALRSALWRCLFGIRDAAEAAPGSPERPRPGKKTGLRAYAVYAIVYRAFVGAALVTLAYVLFPKAAGLPLAALAAYILFLAPLAREAVLLWRKRAAMRFTLGTGLLVLLLAGGGLWFFGSRPRRLTFPAVTRAEAEEAVRARRDGVVRVVHAARGQRVAAGEILAELESPAEEFVLERAEWALREARIGVEQSRVGSLARRESLSREAERRRREDELAALRKQSDLLAVRSPVEGVIAVWDESLVPGTPLRGGGRMGIVAQGAARRLSCYPEVETAGRFEVGAEAFFLPDAGGEWLRGTVADIGQSSLNTVEDGELAHALGALRAGGEYRLPGMPRVRVTVILDEPVDRVGQTGTLRVFSRPESLAARAAAWLRNLAVRESAF